ncbi:hypothetical protein MTR67_001901 [Solanum verrucosum]|uniref:NADH dehydrogenase [ubiquinone] 1 alpha subcomplex subunit 6 n=1 Tax=Solanum verrucosum TaxID=315347 RepID=A0AAF0PTN8_SOLVR|nr:hypothetical protein MTR67_001901 [Solanum verrucosum]
MSQILKSLKVPPNSASLEEARTRTFEFFRMCCRSIPHVMEIYNLHDVVSPSQLRYAAAAEVRKNANVTNPKVIDMLLFKGMEELMNIVNQSKQRHHIVGQYVVGRWFEPQQGHWRHYKPAASPGPRGTNRGGPALKQRDPVGTTSRVRKATPESHG